MLRFEKAFPEDKAPHVLSFVTFLLSSLILLSNAADERRVRYVWPVRFEALAIMARLASSARKVEQSESP